MVAGRRDAMFAVLLSMYITGWVAENAVTALFLGDALPVLYGSAPI